MHFKFNISKINKYLCALIYLLLFYQMKNIILATILFLTPIILYSQGFSTSRNWSRHKHELFLNVGATQFLGEVGGLNREGTNKSLADLDIGSTRFGVGIGYRLRFHPRFATTTNLTYAMLAGADSHTEEIIRRSRNLSFRTHLLELSQKVEFIIYADEESGSSYLQGQRSKADVLYVFTGISGFLFSPQTKIGDKWTNLRPLKTEGQGLPDGADPYGLFNFGIPVGIGFRFGLPSGWRIGIEASYTKTFTDYLDDVSTNYYNPTVLAQEVGLDAVYAANPAIENHGWFAEGQQRGNPDDKDAYFFLQFTITKNITSLGGAGYRNRSRI